LSIQIATMASCEVQETRSQDELKKTENTKNVKNSEERGPLNFKSNNDMDAVATPSSETGVITGIPRMCETRGLIRAQFYWVPNGRVVILGVLECWDPL